MSNLGIEAMLRGLGFTHRLRTKLTKRGLTVSQGKDDWLALFLDKKTDKFEHFIYYDIKKNMFSIWEQQYKYYRTIPERYLLRNNDDLNPSAKEHWLKISSELTKLGFTIIIETRGDV